MSRCTNPKAKDYKRYGGAGIRLCDRWESFENFLEDMGKRPSGTHSIERVNNASGYSPSNCIWATMKTQARNRRDNITIEYNGQRKIITDWAKITGISRHVIGNRIRAGWDPVKSITVPSVTMNKMSKFRGVTRCPHTLKWVASITRNGRYYYLGHFHSEAAAATAYKLKNATLPPRNYRPKQHLHKIQSVKRDPCIQKNR